MSTVIPLEYHPIEDIDIDDPYSYALYGSDTPGEISFFEDPVPGDPIEFSEAWTGYGSRDPEVSYAPPPQSLGSGAGMLGLGALGLLAQSSMGKSKGGDAGSSILDSFLTTQKPEGNLGGYGPWGAGGMGALGAFALAKAGGASNKEAAKSAALTGIGAGLGYQFFGPVGGLIGGAAGNWFS
jgi:hypothetical protein|tara:strand:+ start:81 stop:626 length:546 start_codon:yes stop_codon:yes gene_type:complete